MYHFMKVISFLISLIPVVVLEMIARLLSIVFFDILRIRRKLVLSNIETAFGDVYADYERERIGRESYRNFLLTGFEFLRSPYHDITADFEVEGEAHLRNALSKGKGLYVLCFHMGNWEAMGAYIGTHMHPTYVLVKKVGGKGMNRFVEELRTKNKFLWIKREKKGDGLKGIEETLKRNAIVGFVMDQARPGEPRLPFFGSPAKTNTSFAAIAKKLPAPILTSFIQRKSLGRHKLTFYPEIELTYTDDPEKDIIDQSVLFNQEVEKVVRRKPEQYFWLHNRWK
ncbi:MAG: lysophospholipid acyltransferase family protein [Pseudobacteriovorax sp.]|nr:lysophospholipid acyltransferase family protein [Pseudobacteriovorax sp.]